VNVANQAGGVKATTRHEEPPPRRFVTAFSRSEKAPSTSQVHPVRRPITTYMHFHTTTHTATVRRPDSRAARADCRVHILCMDTNESASGERVSGGIQLCQEVPAGRGGSRREWSAGSS